MKIKFIKNKFDRGFTLIEMMIAISLFLVITTVGIGALLNANLVYKKSQDMRSIMDNLNFAMEDMSKNLRTGHTYYCITGTDDLANVATTKSGQSCWGVAFESAYGDFTTLDGDPIDNNDQWVYVMAQDTSVTPAVTRIYRSTSGPYGALSSMIQLTPNEVEINPSASSVSVLGAEARQGIGNCASPSNCQQPFVTIRLVGQILFRGVATPFSIQTSMSQRLIDV